MITIRVQATNGSTLLKGIESVREQFIKMRIPKTGEVFEGQFWRSEITECVDRLPNMKKTEAIEATRVMCRRERLAAIRDRLAKASPYPWEKCTAHDGRCSCPMIWSVEADAPVVDVLKKWGDGVEGSDSWSEYGRWTEEAFQDNKEFIANAPTDLAFLLAEVERLAAVIISAVETLKAPNPAIADTIWYSPGCTLVDHLEAAARP